MFAYMKTKLTKINFQDKDFKGCSIQEDRAVCWRTQKLSQVQCRTSFSPADFYKLNQWAAMPYFPQLFPAPKMPVESRKVHKGSTGGQTLGWCNQKAPEASRGGLIYMLVSNSGWLSAEMLCWERAISHLIPRIINHEMADKKPVEYMEIFPQSAKPSVRDSPWPLLKASSSSHWAGRAVSLLADPHPSPLPCRLDKNRPLILSFLVFLKSYRSGR